MAKQEGYKRVRSEPYKAVQPTTVSLELIN